MLHLHAGRIGQHSQVLDDSLLDAIQVRTWVLVLDLGTDIWMEREVRTKILKVL